VPQWRKLHTKTLESLDINDMPNDFTRLTWVLLPLILDSEGRGLDNPVWLRSSIFPLREDVTLEMITEAMTWFSDREMIKCYQVGGRKYFCVPTFDKYQDTKREAESKYPAPPEDSDLYNEELPTNSGVTQDQLLNKSTLDIEENRREGEVTPESSNGSTHNSNGNGQTPSQAMFSALAKACKIDYRIATDQQRGELNQSEKMLRTKARASPEDLPDFEKWWYAYDWRGKKGDAPKPTQVREEWQKFIDYRERQAAEQPKLTGNNEEGFNL
jgi:hypothetical protein